MKHPAKSRLMWSGVAVACVGGFLTALLQQPDALPPWVLAIASSLLVPIGILQAALKWADNGSKGKPPPALSPVQFPPLAKPLPRRPGRQERGASEPQALGLVCVVILLILIAVSQCGCGSAWPQRCEIDREGRVKCDCRPTGSQLVHHTVSKTATIECDGEPVPITFDEGP